MVLLVGVFAARFSTFTGLAKEATGVLIAHASCDTKTEKIRSEVALIVYARLCIMVSVVDCFKLSSLKDGERRIAID
jgi:hypothetical protein